MSAGHRLTPTSWLGPTYDPVSMVTELADTLNGQSGQLEQTLVYIDHHSAKDWMATCSTPEYNSEYRDSVPFAAMARQIAQHVGEQALTVTALGCGDGRVEATLTKQLQQRLKMPKQTELFLLDVSHSLLNAAYRHCCETLPDIRTYTIHGSFLDLPKMPMLVNPLRGRSRLFAMLGLTLINLNDELRYFRDTLSCCAPGELFLCDVLIARAPSTADGAVERCGGGAASVSVAWQHPRVAQCHGPGDHLVASPGARSRRASGSDHRPCRVRSGSREQLFAGRSRAGAHRASPRAHPNPRGGRRHLGH